MGIIGNNDYLDLILIGDDNREYLKKMESDGFVVIRSSEDVVLLDIDREENYEKEIVEKLMNEPEYNYINDVAIWESKTKGHKHVKVKLSNAGKNMFSNVVSRLMLAACLGSDPIGILAAYTRYVNGDPENEAWVLFKPKDVSDSLNEIDKMLNDDDVKF